jgi:type I restriction enzyme, S subunit
MAADWEAVPLCQLIEFSRDGEWGSDSPNPDRVEMLVVRGTDFERLRVGALSEIPTRFVERTTAERKQLRAGDVLIETAGGTKEQPTGRTALVKQSHIDTAGLPITCASFARFIRFDQKKVDPRFIYWWFQNLYSSGEMEIHQVQHTGIARFQFTKFAEAVEAPLPPLSVQRAIAHVLGTLDNKIELHRRMNETLEAMARALFKSWFVHFDPVRAKAEGREPGLPKPVADLFPARLVDSELGEIPEGWSVSTIAELANIVGGSTPSTANPAFWQNGKHYWATPKDLSGLSTPVLLSTERKISDAGVTQISSGLLPPGSVLLSSRAPIGYLAIAQIPIAINQGFIAMIPTKGVPNLFLLLWAGWAHDEIISRANGSTFLEISKANFRPIPVVRPPTLIFSAFDRLAAPLFARVVSNERQCHTLAALRDALLPKLISGELRLSTAL